MNDLERKLVNGMLYYQSNLPSSRTSKNDKKSWYDFVYQHVRNQLLPQIKSSGERFVQYWPAQFLWGNKTSQEQSIIDRNVIYRVQEGTFGTGYICVSDANIYIHVYAKLTEKYPLYKRGMIDFILHAIVKNMDKRKKVTRDQNWTIPNQTILGSQITETDYSNTVISLVTATTTWEIESAFLNHELEILAAINLARFGTLANAGRSQAEQSETKISPHISELLKQLHELKKASILTAEEFEAKKREILSRI